jgi:hypothetical protein
MQAFISLFRLKDSERNHEVEYEVGVKGKVVPVLS